MAGGGAGGEGRHMAIDTACLMNFCIVWYSFFARRLSPGPVHAHTPWPHLHSTGPSVLPLQW